MGHKYMLNIRNEEGNAHFNVRDPLTLLHDLSTTAFIIYRNHLRLSVKKESCTHHRTIHPLKIHFPLISLCEIVNVVP